VQWPNARTEQIPEAPSVYAFHVSKSVGIVYAAYPGGVRWGRELIRYELDVKRVERDHKIIAHHTSFSYTSFLRFAPSW
jgi:hypothetical protein